MTKRFTVLRAKMSKAAQARAKARTRNVMAEMLLSELRILMGLTQQELAKKLGVKQPTLSRLESQEDMHISTLRRIIEGIGGRLEIVAHLPGGDVRIDQFKEASPA